MAAQKEFARDFGDLHAGLKQMIDTDRLRPEHIPEDYAWLVGSLGRLQDSAEHRELLKATRRAERKADRVRRGVDITSLRRASQENGIPVKTLQTRVHDHPDWDLKQILAIPHQPARSPS